MNKELVEKIAQAVLYEGYILYPYRPSVKNHHRWTFGGLYPKVYCESSGTGDAWSLLTECVVLNDLARSRASDFVGSAPRTVFSGVKEMVRGADPTRIAQSSLGSDATTLEIEARFLHLINRRVGIMVGPRGNDLQFVDSVSVNGKKYQRWQEAMEREVIVPAITLGELTTRRLVQSFNFPATQTREEIRDVDGRVVVVLVREQQAISGVVEASSQQISDGVFKVSVQICNETSIDSRLPASNQSERLEIASSSIPAENSNKPMLLAAWVNGVDSVDEVNRPTGATRANVPSPQPSPLSTGAREQDTSAPGASAARATIRDNALMRALVSTHAILNVTNGQFISMTDPPDELKEIAAACKNIGVWPVLVGEPGATDAILASPIILYDHPQIAPESPGDLFDGGEIDEILSLRIMTLTDEEKRDVSSVDERADVMLKRTENLAREQLMNLHGGMKNVSPFPASDILPAWDPMADRPKLPSIRAGGVDLHPGDRVRLRPNGGADAFDMMLTGKIATIAVIEQDFEDRIHLAVTVEDDPGADFGVAGKPGHRFFFRPDEVEPV